MTGGGEVHDFQQRHEEAAHAAMTALQKAARAGDNVFAVLMDAARVCSLEQITEAFASGELYEDEPGEAPEGNR